MMFVDINVGTVVPNVEWRMSGATYNPGFSAKSSSYITKRQRTAYLTGQLLGQIDEGLRKL